jgi:hypothetical protein
LGNPCGLSAGLPEKKAQTPKSLCFIFFYFVHADIPYVLLLQSIHDDPAEVKSFFFFRLKGR